MVTSKTLPGFRRFAKLLVLSVYFGLCFCPFLSEERERESRPFPNPHPDSNPLSIRSNVNNHRYK
jgi:hypothetical protein